MIKHVRYSAPALSKGLEALEVLANHKHGLTLKELAQEMSKTVSEIFRMVSVLESSGYIRLTTDGRYVLTLRLFEIAHRHPPIKSLIESASPFMHRLTEETYQSCHLSVYQSGKAIVVAQMESPERWSFNVKVGSMMELVEAASGLVILAFQTPERRIAMLDECRSLIGSLPRGIESIAADIENANRLGYCMMESQHVAGVTNIAFPILGIKGHAIAAIAISYIKRISGDKAVPLRVIPKYLAACAADISRVNGYLPNHYAAAPSAADTGR